MKFALKVNVKTAKQHLWELLTHPERYSSFIPDVKRVSVLERGEAEAMLKWEIGLEGVPLQWIERCTYDSENANITFRSVHGDLPSYDGNISVQHNGHGVTLLLDARLDWNLPSFNRVIAKGTEDRVKRVFASMLVAIKKQAEKTRKDRTYAFVIHPLDLQLISVAFHEPNVAFQRRDLMAKAFEWIAPFKCADIVGLKEPSGLKVIEGVLIYCPLLPEQMIGTRDKIALKRTIEAVEVGKDLGAKIVGLGAYAAQIGRKGLLVADAVHVPITTGTSYTIAVALRGIELACNAVGAELQEMSVGIVGASGNIGTICAELLAGRVKKLILMARNKTRLVLLSEKLNATALCEVEETTDLDRVIAQSDVIVAATNTPESFISATSLKPGTIVCDVSRPGSVVHESVLAAKGNVLVFDGGIVQPPGSVDFDFYFGLPPGLAYACMAETMILALSEKYESYSLGGNVSTEKVRAIEKLGDGLGFRVAQLRWHDKEISQEVFSRIRGHIRSRW